MSGGVRIIGIPALSPDNVPASSHADDYEFNNTSSSLPSGWSWFNQGTATYAEADGAGLITEPGKTTENWRGIVRAIPAGTSWTATAKLSCSGRFQTDTYDMALILRESSSGKIQELDRYSHSTITNGACYVNRWTNSTTYSASPAGATPVHGRFDSILYFRIKKNSATSYDFLVSPDGLGYHSILAANDVSAFMTPDQIGFGLNSRNNVPSTVACHWYRVTA